MINVKCLNGRNSNYISTQYFMWNSLEKMKYRIVKIMKCTNVEKNKPGWL